MPSTKSLTSFIIWIFFRSLLFCLGFPALCRRDADSGIVYFVSSLRRKAFSCPPLCLWWNVGWPYRALIIFIYSISILSLLSITRKEWFIFSTLSSSIEIFYAFIIYSASVVHFLYWLGYVELSLHPSDKFHLLHYGILCLWCSCTIKFILLIFYIYFKFHCICAG